MSLRILVPFALLSLLVACAPDSPERRIQKAFDACVKAVEEKDAATVVSHLSGRFAGPEGMDRDQAKLVLLGYLRHQKLGITVLENRLQVRGARGEQAVDLILAGKADGALLPEDSTRRTFRLRWELEGDLWKLRELKEERERP